MAEITQNAQARGLTPEVLEELLRDYALILLKLLTREAQCPRVLGNGTNHVLRSSIRNLCLDLEG